MNLRKDPRPSFFCALSRPPPPFLPADAGLQTRNRRGLFSQVPGFPFTDAHLQIQRCASLTSCPRAFRGRIVCQAIIIPPGPVSIPPLPLRIPSRLHSKQIPAFRRIFMSLLSLNANLSVHIRKSGRMNYPATSLF